MTQMLYAIIDIETTGGRAERDKITEIAIVLHDGEKIVDTFETLLNPECMIPYGITQLTGITMEMVQGAPRFYEIAKKVVEMTEGAIFVAHNVRFDYSFIRAEFQRLGFTYTRKQLCTVRMSRKAFPGLPSYSLGKLITHFNIKVESRHRAMADTMATVELFEKIIGKKESEAEMKSMINLGVKEALLPKNITLEMLHALPEATGVYYFHAENGQVVYVGKSINIKKRVAEHFSKKTEKASKLQKFVHDISFEITGSEVAALLLESFEIKHLRPFINRAQRARYFPYIIHTYENQGGYICFDTEKVTAQTRHKFNIISEYPKLRVAQGHLKKVLAQFELCSRHCNIEKGNGACFDFHLKRCYGACVAQESAADYNERAEAAKELLSTIFEDNFFLIDRGRTETESVVVLVEDGEYCGFGYAEISEMIGDLQELRDVIKTYPSNPETKRIIRRFLSDNNKIKVIKF